MGLMYKIVKQAGYPTGTFGKLMVRLMNYGHGKVTRWGLSHLSISKSDTILDIGCGGGKTINILARIATQGKVYGVDLSEVSVAVSRKTNKKLIKPGQIEILQASVASLPFPDDFFDLVTAVETYYFWPDLVDNLKEIRRVLKHGGSVALINEMYRDNRFEKRNAKWAKIVADNYHLPEEFRKFLKDAGYSSIQIEVLEDKNWITAMETKN